VMNMIMSGISFHATRAANRCFACARLTCFNLICNMNVGVVWMYCSGRSVSPSDATLRRLQSRLETRSPGLAMLTAGGRTSPTVYFGQSRDGSISSLTGNDTTHLLLETDAFSTLRRSECTNCGSLQ